MVQPEWRGKKDPGQDYDRDKNDNLTLSCPADGTPRPKVTWKKVCVCVCVCVHACVHNTITLS
ncbi:hypothetical protein E2C01_088673 [Portunus trituberculatus]|uniref:Ig-like domain-containing protein n=1 Tax=Portunus trituberculatus TaxID=210409 RepID=A0A5B7J9X6_PORTR|nr:hypothetical protein [Portunus trituberculatus]